MVAKYAGAAATYFPCMELQKHGWMLLKADNFLVMFLLKYCILLSNTYFMIETVNLPDDLVFEQVDQILIWPILLYLVF